MRIVNYYLHFNFLIFNAVTSKSNEKSNIVFILTDDQDIELGGLDPLVKSKELIGNAGAFFTNSFVTTPLCCPSRSSILTGKYTSNIYVRNNSISGNCSSRAWQKSFEQRTFINILDKYGYNTFFAGKYLNQYGSKLSGGVNHIPPGWRDWNGLVGNSVYYNYTLSVNGIPEHHGDEGHNYLTDVIMTKSLDFLERHINSKSTPFFMWLSPPACHAPFTPAHKYRHNFSQVKAPRTPNFGRHFLDKHWLLRNAKSPMGNMSLEVIDESFVNRWRTLLSVDDMVEKIITFLDINDLLSSTYIVFSSDNGFHLGQFSLPIDKRQPYEFDIRVPLMVRGPNIGPKQFIKVPVLNIDLASTFLDMAGIYNDSMFNDGDSWLPLVSQNSFKRNKFIRSAFVVQYEGESQDIIDSCPHLNHQHVAQCHPECVCEDSRNNTYSCVRALNADINVLHCNFIDDEKFVETYDMTNDPYQLINLASNATKIQLMNILDNLLLLFK